MKAVQISGGIIPLAEFKTQASAVLRQLRDDKRPIVITQNGRPAAVLLTPDEFDRLSERERFLASVDRGLQDSEAGRVTDDIDLDAELDAELGRAASP